MLDFAKVERGVMEYRFTEVQVNQIVQKVLQSLKYQFKMEKCTVRATLSRKEFTIHADADAITEGLMNILTNALKYSTVKKHIAVSTFQRNGFVAVKIQDRGIGIPQEDLENIFEPFFRSRAARKGEAGGVGLGLRW